MDAGGDSLDNSTSGIVLDISFVSGLLQSWELNRPNSFTDGIVAQFITLTLPESLNNVLHTDDAFLTKNFFDDHIICDGQSLWLLALQVASLPDNIIECLLCWCTPAYVVLNGQKLVQISSWSSEECTVVNLLQAEFFENFLCLRSGITWLFDTHDQDKTVDGNSLLSGEDQCLLVFDFLTEIAWSLRLLHSLILHKVSLLLHIVRYIDLWKKYFFATSDGQFLISFLLTNLSHLLSGTVILLSLLDQIVSLALFEERLLLDIKTFHATEFNFF